MVEAGTWSLPAKIHPKKTAIEKNSTAKNREFDFLFFTYRRVFRPPDFFLVKFCGQTSASEFDQGHSTAQLVKFTPTGLGRALASKFYVSPRSPTGLAPAHQAAADGHQCQHLGAVRAASRCWPIYTHSVQRVQPAGHEQVRPGLVTEGPLGKPLVLLQRSSACRNFRHCLHVGTARFTARRAI